MVLSRGADPAGDETPMTPDSVPDIGRALQHARTQAGLSLPEAARRTGLAPAELEALESGTVGRMADRIGTLRALRIYADTLGLPGDGYVLSVVALWPSLDLPARNDTTGVVPVVSVSMAPAGGHSPAGDYGSAFPAGSTGVSDSTITGVMGPVGPLPINDTRQVPAYETSQVPVVRQGAPRYLKVLVALVALLVVTGGVGLLLHKQVSGWIHSAQTETNSLLKDGKKDAGFGSATPGSRHHTTAAPGPKVTVVNHAGGTSVTLNVTASAFSVDVLATPNPSWVQVTDSGSQAPVFAQVIPGGQNRLFPVTQSATIETGSLSGRFLVLDGKRIIGSYIPTKAPFTATFNATN